jgi:hypothetical protein
MNGKSNSCMNKRTGEPLTEYYSEYEAQDGANYANATYGHNLVPYKCDKCGLWHLSPKNRQTPSTKCYACTDSRGYLKSLYQTREHAKTRAEILYKEKGIRLKIYRCVYSDGWHLTKGS